MSLAVILASAQYMPTNKNDVLIVFNAETSPLYHRKVIC